MIPLILFLIISSIAYAENSSSGKRLVKIAVFRNAQPVSYVDDRGEAAGIFPYILEDILDNAGYQSEFIIFDTFQEAFTAVTSGTADIMPALIKTSEREQVLDFNDISFITAWGQVFAAESSKIESVYDLQNKMVGMLKGGQNGIYFKKLMNEFCLEFEPVEFNTFEEISSAIASGAVDAGVFFNTFTQPDDLAIKPTNVVFSPSNSYIGVTKGKNTDLIYTIDSGLAKAKSDSNSFYYDIMKKYRLIYVHYERSLPGWLIILLVSACFLLAASIVFIFLLRFLVRKATFNLNIEKERAEKNDMLKTGFLLKVSHELRTPLNGIMGMQTLLGYTELDSDQRRYLELGIESADDLNRIIQHLLDFQESSRPEAEITIQKADLSEIINSIIKPLRAYSAEKNTKIIVDTGGEQIVHPTDIKCLKQILIHLILNAVDFSGGKDVTVKLERIDGTPEINIIDNGIGIEKSMHEDVFIPFHQLEDPYTRRHGGLGLGLSIARQAADMIDAEIFLESEPGRGSTFSIRLR